MLVSGYVGIFSCPQQLNRTHCPSLGPSVHPLPLTIRVFTTLQSDPRDLWPLRHLIRVMRRHDLTKKYLPTYIPTHLPTYLCTSIREQPKGAIIGTCDIWDTDNNTDNWEPGFMTIFVTWQLIVTLYSIRNSCDVSIKAPMSSMPLFSVWNYVHICLTHSAGDFKGILSI